MRIAVYGGSFNPPHLGHVEACKTIARILQPERLIIIPDNIPPHKKLSEGSPSPEERLALCRLAFSEVPGAELSDMELRRKGKSYTFETVERLREQYPEDELYLVIGSDMFLCFETWFRFRFLMENTVLTVLPRTGEELDALRAHATYMEDAYGTHVVLLPHEPVVVSSSEIRTLLQRRMGRELLSSAVYAEIIRCRWYGARPELAWLREQSYAMLKPGRIAHVAGCEREAVKLAIRWGEDPELAAEAAILHDITKRFSYDEQLNLCEKYGIINDQAELAHPNILHAMTGAAYARDRFGVDDPVYQAIRWHTTGKPDMTLLEKIIYLADTIEPTREYSIVDQLRRQCYIDIDKAMAMTLNRTLEHIRAKGEEPYRITAEAAAWYAEQRE